LSVVVSFPFRLDGRHNNAQAGTGIVKQPCMDGNRLKRGR